MTKKLLSLFIALSFVFFATACTPEIIINMDENNKTESSDVGKEQSNNTQGSKDKETPKQDTNETIPEKSVNSQKDESPKVEENNNVKNDSTDKNNKNDNPTINTNSDKITAEKAKEIALNKAGLKATDIFGYKIELDKDDGVESYEIEFKSGRTEYSFDIKATDGTIIEFEKDIDD